MQKTDENCIVEEIPVGDASPHGCSGQAPEESSIICNWSPELLQSLLESSEIAKGGCSA